MNIKNVLSTLMLYKFLDKKSYLEFYKNFIIGVIFKRKVDYNLILKNGAKINVTTNTGGPLSEIFAFGIYNFPKFNKKIRIADVGANVGFFSLYCDILGINSDIIAIEPDKNNIKILKENIKSLKNITISPYAVGAKTGVIKLFLYNSIGNSIYNNVSGEYEFVNMKKFDSLGRFDLIKMDIEGAEHEIFKTQKNWKHADYLMIEFHGTNEEINETKNIIKKYFDETKSIFGVSHFLNKGDKK